MENVDSRSKVRDVRASPASYFQAWPGAGFPDSGIGRVWLLIALCRVSAVCVWFACRRPPGPVLCRTWPYGHRLVQTVTLISCGGPPVHSQPTMPCAADLGSGLIGSIVCLKKLPGADTWQEFSGEFAAYLA